MSLIYNKTVFTNVTTIENILGNIKTVALNNNWIVDLDDIATSGTLYMHNLGNGSQTLYFSFQAILGTTSSQTEQFYYLHTFGNTGFDSTLAVDAQPGRYSVNYKAASYTGDLIFQFPIITQYVLCNGTNLCCILDFDCVSNVDGSQGRILPHFLLGSMDSYKSGETEGNVCCFSPSYDIVGWDGITDGYLTPFVFSGISTNGLLYNSIGNSPYNSIDYETKTAGGTTGEGSRYPLYNSAIQYNTTASRTTLIKPILTLSYATSTDTYNYPIGELPYYACMVYPYAKAGDVITAGTRSFVVFPLLKYTDAYGVAFEV